MKYLLDTDTCVYAMRQRAAVVRRILQVEVEDLAISVITDGELWLAKHKAHNQALAQVQLSRLLPYLQILTISAEVAENYAVIRAFLENSGQIIGANDLWIAAHALSLDLTLVTNNEREFQRVPNLRIENWTRPA